MKRWLTPTALTGLLGAVTILLPAWAGARRAQTEAADAAWKRENGMAHYEQAFQDALADRMRLEAAVLNATNLNELKQTVEDNR